MGTIATTVNAGATEFDVVLKECLDLGVAFLEAAMKAEAPWTGLPVVSNIIDLAIGYVEDKIYEGIAENGNYLIIKFQSVVEKTAYFVAYNDYATALKGGDPLQIQAAKLAWADAVSSFIHDDGSA